jgi:hypothetical protein
VFEQFFVRPHVLACQRNGPLAEERHRYLVHGAEQQMSPATLRDIAFYILHAAKTLPLADHPGERISLAEIEAAADCWARRPPGPYPPREVRRSGSTTAT